MRYFSQAAAVPNTSQTPGKASPNVAPGPEASFSMDPKKIRNIAIIAHVDHGKTTLVDSLLKESNIKISNTCELDSGELEREKGITIVAKVTSISYKGHTINIVDTPGHQDFGGQVERVMSLVDGVLLVVCACEGIMKQTRFVLEKALAKNLKPIVFVNKVDREAANISETENLIFDLFCTLTHDENLLEYITLFGSGKAGYAVRNKDDLKNKPQGMEQLLDAIIEHVPPPKSDYDPNNDYAKNPDCVVQVTQVDRDPYFGKVVRGRIERGKLQVANLIRLFDSSGALKSQGAVSRITKAIGLTQHTLKEAVAGDIVAITGIEKAGLGDVLLAGDKPVDYTGRKIEVDPPLLSVEVSANVSPFAGKNGATKTSFYDIASRLEEEADRDPAIKTKKIGQKIRLYTRGDLHMGVLLEKMRREGYEFEVGAPKTETKIDEKGRELEPIEEVKIEVPFDRMSMLIDKLLARKADIKDSDSVGEKYQRVTARIPSRGVLGLHSELITETNNDVRFETHLVGYEPLKGSVKKLRRPCLLCSTSGQVTAYGMKDIDRWGTFFVKPGVQVFAGQVIGLSIDKEMTLNPCKEKHLTNVRTTEKEEKISLSATKEFSVEEAIGFIEPDEIVEVSPNAIRIRKTELSADARKKTKN